MNRKFGGGKKLTGTPSMAWSCVVVVASLLAGASIVHNIYKPDLKQKEVKNRHNMGRGPRLCFGNPDEEYFSSSELAEYGDDEIDGVFASAMRHSWEELVNKG